MSRRHTVQKLANNYKRDTKGTIAILFALGIFAIIGAMALAVDFSRAFHVRTQLTSAADAAAIAAAKHAALLVKNGKTEATAKTQAKEVGLQVWSANIQDADATVAPPVINLSSDSEGRWTARLDFTGSVETTLAAVMGYDQVPVGGNTEVQSGGINPAYMDFYLLLDNSQSMGVAATQSGMSSLENAKGCIFGCHVPGMDQNYNYAKSNGIDMRIDVLRDAVIRLITTAENTARSHDHYRIGMWTFDNNQRVLAAPTDDLGQVQTAASQIDLPTYHDGTQADDALAYLNNQVTRTGDGTAPDKPIKYVFLVTDGVQDGLYTGWQPPPGLPTSTYHPGFSGKNSPVSPDACNSLKSKGIIVAVLYTKYHPFTDPDNTYASFVQPFEDDIVPNLQSCASPGYFFEATHGSDIDPALQHLFKTAVAHANNVRVTK